MGINFDQLKTSDENSNYDLVSDTEQEGTINE